MDGQGAKIVGGLDPRAQAETLRDSEVGMVLLALQGYSVRWAEYNTECLYWVMIRLVVEEEVEVENNRDLVER